MVPTVVADAIPIPPPNNLSLRDPASDPSPVDPFKVDTFIHSVCSAGYRPIPVNPNQSFDKSSTSVLPIVIFL